MNICSGSSLICIVEWNSGFSIDEYMIFLPGTKGEWNSGFSIEFWEFWDYIYQPKFPLQNLATEISVANTNGIYQPNLVAEIYQPKFRLVKFSNAVYTLGLVSVAIRLVNPLTNRIFSFTNRFFGW